MNDMQSLTITGNRVCDLLRHSFEYVKEKYSPIINNHFKNGLKIAVPITSLLLIQNSRKQRMLLNDINQVIDPSLGEFFVYVPQYWRVL